MKSAAETAPATTPETANTESFPVVDVRSAIVSGDEIPDQRYVGPTAPEAKYFDSLLNERRECDVTTSKPSGGIWTAPKTPSGNTFSDKIGQPEDTGVWDIQFSADTRVLVVNSEKILESLPTYSIDKRMAAIDFETLFSRYDINGVYVTVEMVRQYGGRNQTPSLHMWDIESCIWNTLDMIESVHYCGTIEQLEAYVEDTTEQQTL